MSSEKINFKPGYVSSLSVLLALGLISLPLAGVAQNNYKSSGYISQELNSTVKQSRQAGTEIILRQTALQLLDLRETIASNESSPDTLKPAVPGVLPDATDYLHPNRLGRNSQGNNYDFLYLPTQLGKPKDANGIPLAYCAFNFPNEPASGNRLGGSNRLQPSDAKDALGFAIISAGANGRFDLSCDRFRNIKKGEMNNDTDDLYVIQSFHDITYAGANSRYVEKSVDKYDDLDAIPENFRYDGQIRWVKKTNQFFRYHQTTRVWSPLNAGFQPNTSATGDPTQIELNWLSGSMGIGTGTQPNVAGTNSARAMLTLGKKRQDKSGALAINQNYLAGIGFNKTTDDLFAYIGLIDDNTFALRQGNDNRLLLDNQGNLTFSGNSLTVTGLTTFRDALTANGGLNATTGTFSGLLSANGGFNATTGSFSGLLQANGGLNASTGSFSGLLNANGGLNASTGNFSGLLSANGGLSATEGNFTGNLSAINGTFSGVLSGGSVTTGGSLSAGSISTAGTLSSGALSATTGIFSGLLTANGGLNATTGTFSELLTANGGLNATTGNFSGLLTANGGLNATTGNFSGLLSANGGLSVNGELIANNGLDVRGQLNVTGTLQVNGINLSDPLNLNVYGYTVRNGGAELIGSAQINSNRNIVLYLKQPNDFLYDVDQSLSTSSAPRFNSLNVSSNIQANFISANSAQFSSISGNLAGNASSADRLNKRLFLRLSGNLQTNYTEINLNSDQNDIFADINYTGDVAQHIDQRYAPVIHPTYQNYDCSGSGSCSNIVSNITNTTLAGNSYNNNSPTYPQYTININGGSNPTIVQTARKLESPAIINLTGDFISSVSGSFQGGETTNITLTSQGLTFAKDMDQYLKKSSEVTFSKITAGAGGAIINGPLTTQTLQVMNSATIANSLKILDGSGTGTIEINGGSKFISFLGGGGNVTAQFFNGDLKGNADTATKLKNPIQLTVTGDLVGNSSTSDNINYNLNLTLANNTISTDKLQNAAITNSKIADNAVSTSKLQDLAISTSKIQDAAVTTGKIADNAISTSKLQDFAVTTAKIANGNITTEKLAIGATIDNARALVSPSDLRLKEGITTIEGLSLLERLSKINLFGYSFRDDPMHSRTLGVLAQELQPLFPELVSVQTEGKHAGYYAVNYGLMGALASAGVGHLNKKLDSLGLQLKDPRTLSANLPNFTVSNITAERIETKKLKAREIEAGKGNFEDLSSDKFSATNGKAVRMQADTINSGQTEGYAGLGSALPLFGGGMEGHYIVNVSSPDGSYATASVFVSGGQIHVVPMATQNISIVPSMGMVHAVANGKVLKATWLKTG